MRSDDGRRWALGTSLAEGFTFHALKFAGANYLALGEGNASTWIFSSEDSIAWTGHALPSAAMRVYDAVYFSGRYLVAGLGIFASPDLVTWQQYEAAPLLGEYASIAASEHEAVAVSTTGHILRTLDGVVWTEQFFSAALAFISVSWDGNRFLASTIDHADGTWGSDFYVSPDGIAWTQATFQIDASDASIVRAVSTCGNVSLATFTKIDGTFGIAVSRDGERWASVPLPSSGPLETLSGATCSGGEWVLVGASFTGQSAYIYMSEHPAWTLQEYLPEGLSSIAWGQGHFVATSTSGSLFTSSDAISWTRQVSGVPGIEAVAYGEGRFFAVGQHGLVLCSEDAQTWTTERTFADDTFVSVAIGPTAAVTLGASGLTLTRGLDSCGSEWATSMPASGGFFWTNVIWAGDQFAVSAPGVMLGLTYFSPDGNTWTPQTPDIQHAKLSYFDHRFHASNSQGLDTSSDGLHWSADGVRIAGYRVDTFASSGTDVVGVGTSGQMLRRGANGVWTAEFPGVSILLTGIAADAAHRLVAVGADGSILINNDVVFLSGFD